MIRDMNRTDSHLEELAKKGLKMERGLEAAAKIQRTIVSGKEYFQVVRFDEPVWFADPEEFKGQTLFKTREELCAALFGKKLFSVGFGMSMTNDAFGKRAQAELLTALEGR